MVSTTNRTKMLLLVTALGCALAMDKLPQRGQRQDHLASVEISDVPRSSSFSTGGAETSTHHAAPEELHSPLAGLLFSTAGLSTSGATHEDRAIPDEALTAGRTRLLIFERHGESVMNKAVEMWMPSNPLRPSKWRAPCDWTPIGRNTRENRGERWADANLSRGGRQQADLVYDNYHGIKANIERAYLAVVGRPMSWEHNISFRVSPMTRAIETAVRGFVGAVSEHVTNLYFAIDRNVWETATRKLFWLKQGGVNLSALMQRVSSNQDYPEFATMEEQLAGIDAQLEALPPALGLDRVERADHVQQALEDLIEQQRRYVGVDGSSGLERPSWTPQEETGDRPQRFLKSLFDNFGHDQAAFYVGHSKFFESVMQILEDSAKILRSPMSLADSSYCTTLLKNTEIVALAVQEVHEHTNGRTQTHYVLRRVFDGNTRGTRAIYRP